jgi:hypothetical protein
MASGAANIGESEHRLVHDLGALRDNLREDAFATELYRGLANNALRREDDPDSRVALSWRRAEEIVNGLRERAGEQPLTLAQTGGEGELSDRVVHALDGLGWQARPLDTSHDDSGHVSEPNSPPPRGQGERDAPSDQGEVWRDAHAEAERRS